MIELADALASGLLLSHVPFRSSSPSWVSPELLSHHASDFLSAGT